MKGNKGFTAVDMRNEVETDVVTTRVRLAINHKSQQRIAHTLQQKIVQRGMEWSEITNCINSKLVNIF